jgi:hypothetical protein
MKSLRPILPILALLAVVPALAQETTSSNMEILRQKVKADKKLLVDQNMQLTEAEATGVWPIYEAYQKELDGINKRTGSLIKSYAGDYSANTLTDEKAKKLLDEALPVR